MADPGDASSVPVVRTRVNGRSYSFDGEDGRVLKGPGATVGKFIALNQLDRIASSDGYYGHLFLADTPELRRLEEAAFALMEYREENGMVTLVEGMMIKFNGQSARVGEMDARRVKLHFGNMERVMSRARVEQEAEGDFSEAALTRRPDAPAMFPDDAPDLIDPIKNVRESQQQMQGEVEIDTDDLAAKVAQKLMEGDFAQVLADSIRDRLGNTSGDNGKATEQPDIQQ